MLTKQQAKLAWANGEELEFYSPDLDVWFGLNDEPFMSDVFDTRPIRLKPRTITINGIEVPAPFEPKEGDTVFIPVNFLQQGYIECKYPTFEDHCYQFGAWRTEDDIKKVVATLRSIFNESHSNSD